MKLIQDMAEPELSRLMKMLASRVEDGCLIFGVEKPKFALLVFNDPAVGQYISNCTRESMIAALRETADRIESKQDVARD